MDDASSNNTNCIHYNDLNGVVHNEQSTATTNHYKQSTTVSPEDMLKVKHSVQCQEESLIMGHNCKDGESMERVEFSTNKDSNILQQPGVEHLM